MARELGRSLPDVWTGERQRGVQLHLLERSRQTWRERYGQRAWVRQLEGTIERPHEDRLMEVIERFDGRPFPTTPGLVTAVGRPVGPAPLVVAGDDLLRRARRHDLPAHGSPPQPATGELVRPRRFWSGDRIELIAPFALGGEIAVR